MRRSAACPLLLIALALAAPAGCIDSAARLREHTYPPSFEYISDARLKNAMWLLARDVGLLEQALRQPDSAPAAQQAEVAALLARMEDAVARIDTPGRVTQHPLLNQHLPRLRQRVRRARAEVESTPPLYFSASALVGNCSSCHDGARR